MIGIPFEEYSKVLEKNNLACIRGKIKQVIGIVIHAIGLKVFMGEVCRIIVSKDHVVLAEVVGFKDETIILMPLGDVQGIGPGCMVEGTGKSFNIKVGDELLGTTIDGLGNPLLGESFSGIKGVQDVHKMPPHPLERKRIQNVMQTGIKAIDGLLTCGEGQRMGVFAGSGVGKSTLLGMIARYGEADVNVIALIGERGREVVEFIENDLKEDGYKKSVVVCATSDQPPLVRLKGAFVATSIAEYFRDQGKKVMLIMDSVTRFAMAQREIGLAIGEPPTTKGYTPSVFAMLPRLLERSGMSKEGSITAFYSVLVEGDDMNEPIADSVRGILDGHIVLSRKLAGRNHFPAIDIRNSISRIMKDIVEKDHFQAAGNIRENLSRYEDSEDLINIGAYRAGSNPHIDKAIALNGKITDFLKQDVEERWSFEDSERHLFAIDGQ